MTIQKLKTGLFNTNSYENPDRRYDSFDFVKSTSFTHNGYVQGNESEFSVSLQAGLVLNVNKGLYNIGGHYVENSSTQTLALSPTSTGKERYDIIVVGVTRNSSTIIDGQTLSREGYIRVIQGSNADIGLGTIPFNEIISETFQASSGTKEIELAIVKVVSGSISEVIDKRVSTTSEKVKTYTLKVFEKQEDETVLIDFNEYNINSQTELSPTGEITGGFFPNDLINKEIQFVANNDFDLLDSDFFVKININGVEKTIQVVRFKQDSTQISSVYKLLFYEDDGFIKLRQAYELFKADPSYWDVWVNGGLGSGEDIVVYYVENPTIELVSVDNNKKATFIIRDEFPNGMYNMTFFTKTSNDSNRAIINIKNEDDITIYSQICDGKRDEFELKSGYTITIDAGFVNGGSYKNGGISISKV